VATSRLTTHEPDEVLTLQEAADRLGVHVQTVRRWVTNGLLPAHRLGPTMLRVYASDVEKVRRSNDNGKPAAIVSPKKAAKKAAKKATKKAAKPPTTPSNSSARHTARTRKSGQ
jgi:excisionase family DNA binding protein